MSFISRGGLLHYHRKAVDGGVEGERDERADTDDAQRRSATETSEQARVGVERSALMQ